MSKLSDNGLRHIVPGYFNAIIMLIISPFFQRLTTQKKAQMSHLLPASA